MDEIVNVCRFSYDITDELSWFNQIKEETMSSIDDEHVENENQPEDIDEHIFHHHVYLPPPVTQ